MPLTQVSPAVLDSQANAQGFRNRIINGDMRIDQRNNGASVSIGTGAPFIVDRWNAYTDLLNMTGQRSTLVPSGFTNSLGITVGTGASPSAGQISRLEQRIEGFNFADLGWGAVGAQSITMSFLVRSSVTGTHSGALGNQAGNRGYPFTFTISAANTWEYKTVTIAGDTTGTWLTDNSTGCRVIFNLGTGSTFLGTAGSWAASNFFGATGSVQLAATSGATFYITGVQLEVGTVATAFERLDYGRQFDQCRRYCEVYSTGNGTDAGIPQYLAQVDNNNRPEITLLYYPKRAAPSITVSNATQFSWLSAANTSSACTAFPGTLLGTTTNSAVLFFNTASGVTVNTLSGVGTLIFTPGSQASITVSAEL